jgi:hypothetical protein
MKLTGKFNYASKNRDLTFLNFHDESGSNPLPPGEDYILTNDGEELTTNDGEFLITT